MSLGLEGSDDTQMVTLSTVSIFSLTPGKPEAFHTSLTIFQGWD